MAGGLGWPTCSCVRISDNPQYFLSWDFLMPARIEPVRLPVRKAGVFEHGSFPLGNDLCRESDAQSRYKVGLSEKNIAQK